MILQRNIVASAIGQAYGNAETEAGDLHISYLPLSHIYQQFVEIMCMLVGVGLGYFSGDMLRLIEDIQVLKPHVGPHSASKKTLTDSACAVDHGRCSSCLEPILSGHQGEWTGNFLLTLRRTDR